MDAYTTALTLLSRRELSSRQLRERLARRKFEADAIEAAVQRLSADRTLDDRRVALAYARMGASIRGRGKRRVMQAIQRLGIDADVAADAVSNVFDELDEDALLQKALEKRLRGASVRDLDDRAKSRVIRQLVGQGFSFSHVMRALRG